LELRKFVPYDTFFSATFNSETVLGFGLNFWKSFMHRSQTLYLQRIQIWRVTWPLFVVNHLRTVGVPAQLSDTC